MATRNHIITNGPSKWDLMLALFDSEDRQRLVSFTAESERHRELKPLRKQYPSSGYEGLTREQELEVKVYDLDIGPYEMKVNIRSVARKRLGWWEIYGWEMDAPNFVKITYSSQTRKGEVEIEEPDHECLTCGEVISKDDVASHAHMPEEEDIDLNAPWTCDWCKNSLPNSEQPNLTFDGGTICHACFRRDDEGPQIARYGNAEYEANNEPERVVDADGKVYYE